MGWFSPTQGGGWVYSALPDLRADPRTLRLICWKPVAVPVERLSVWCGRGKGRGGVLVEWMDGWMDGWWW